MLNLLLFTKEHVTTRNISNKNKSIGQKVVWFVEATDLALKIPFSVKMTDYSNNWHTMLVIYACLKFLWHVNNLQNDQIFSMFIEVSSMLIFHIICILFLIRKIHYSHPLPLSPPSDPLSFTFQSMHWNIAQTCLQRITSVKQSVILLFFILLVFTL